ncbi:MAG: BatA and WFA domain-containing protein [Thermomicrobia bacterium]|nr:BatA and WFA domain-containing protein [Thermomicrobia bacterium]
MTLLAPLALLGLVALPLIYVLYMREDAPDTFPVPTLRFWTEATSERGRHFHRRRPPLTWLMLAQMLIALILVGALARPLLDVGFLRPSGGARQLFIVLNGGSSMGATDIAPTRFARAKERAVTLIGGLAPDETATVMALGSEVRMLGAGDGIEQLALKEKLNALTLPGGHANFQDALGVLHPLLNPQQRNEVVVITDGDLLGTDALSPDDKIPASIRVENVTQGENPAATANVAITQASTRVSQRNADQEEFFTRIANYADTPATVTLRPSFNDIASAEENVTIDSSQTIERTYTMPKGTTKAKLEARTPQPDAFPADNVAEVVARGGRGSRAVLVTTKPGADTPLVRALKASPNIKLEVHDAAEKPDLAALGGSFLVLDGVAPDLGNLPARTPVLVVNPQAGGPLLTVTGVSSVVSPPRLTDAGTRDVLLKNVDFAGIKFNRLPLVAPPLWANALVVTDQGPLLLSGEQNGRRVVVLTAPLVADATNFIARVSFPVLIANITEYLVPPLLPGSVTPGNTVAIPPIEGADRVTVTQPDGKSRTFPVSTDRTPIPFGATEAPGVYQVLYTGGGKDLLTDAFTVNVGDELESDLRPGRVIDLSSIAGGASTTRAADAPQRRGVGVAPWLLAGVLILLAAEWLLISRKRGTGRRGSPQPSALHRQSSKGRAS